MAQLKPNAAVKCSTGRFDRLALTALTRRASPIPTMNRDFAPQSTPVLIVPYVWIGDFVRCHSVVKVLHTQSPDLAIDILSSTLCAPLADYMPGVRKAVVFDLPRRSLPLARYFQLADVMRGEHYAQALIMLRTWKSALAPWLAGIPLRTGFVGELRYGLINDLRRGERALPRMIDRMAALALLPGEKLPAEWPLPELRVPESEIETWRAKNGLQADGRPVVAFCPGAVGKGKAWPAGHYAALARDLAKDRVSVWVLGGPSETALAAEITAAGRKRVRDLTGNDLRNAIIALAAADAAVTNDSGLMHVAAAIGTPTMAIFGPTSPWHWKPLNPVEAILEPPTDATTLERMRTQGNDAVAHRRTADVPVADVTKAVRAALVKKR
jgi:heptosyltransferase-2